MKQKYPLYRQSLEFYVALKLHSYFKNLPKQKEFVVPGIGYPYLVPLLDSVILTKNSSIYQILPTNTVSATTRLPTGADIKISNTRLLSFESYYDIIEYLKQKFPDQDDLAIQKIFALVFNNEPGFVDTLENSLKKYLLRFVDNQLHELNSCKFEYQVEVFRNTIIELSKKLNLNHIRLDSQNTFGECNCKTHFFEVIGALYLSGTIQLHQIDFNPIDRRYTATIGVKSPEKIDSNSVRAYFGLSIISGLTPTFYGESNHAYENGQLSLKLDDGSVVTFDMATKPATRYLFEAFYELRRSAPKEKEYFTAEEITEKYIQLHKRADEPEYRTIAPGRIGDRKGNCIAQMFKGNKKQYRDHVIWDSKYQDGKITYTFRIQ